MVGDASIALAFACLLLGPLVPAMVGLLIRRKSRVIVGLLVAILFCTLAISSLLVIGQGMLQEPVALGIQWFSIGKASIFFSLLLDRTSFTMLLLVYFMALVITIYAMSYLKDDDRNGTFFMTLSLFASSMGGVVLSDNLLFTFICWELVGFCSWKLIGHWHKQQAVAASATLAFVTTRLADLGFIIAMALLWNEFGTLHITSLLQAPTHSHWAYTCLLISVLGKSAQLPFSGWLTSAMVGPTPASALIHSATMVVAGIYLLIRLSVALPPETLDFMMYAGSITSVAAGIAALMHYNLKKILAFSTISQLGLMLAATGAGGANQAFTHLFVHAFFKAGLFLMAGVIIQHLAKNEQHTDTGDIRSMQGIGRNNPLVFIVGLLFLAALAGVPPAPGFFTKEALLLSITNQAALSTGHMVTMILCWISVPITALYAFRLYGYLYAPHQGHKSMSLALPISVSLLVLTTVLYLVGMPILLVLDTFHLTWETGLSVGLIGLTALAAFRMHKSGWWTNGYHADKTTLWLYDRTVTRPTLFFSGLAKRTDRGIDTFLHLVVYTQVGLAFLARWLDKFLVDGMLVKGTVFIFTRTGLGVRSLVSGKVQSYLIWVAFVLLLVYIVVWKWR